MSCAVGIMAHDEEANIAAAMASVLSQRGPRVEPLRLVVVASGCTDGTVPRAREVEAGDPRARVLTQERREGKAAAVNVFLEAARDEALLVLAGGDTRVEPGALERLLEPFDDPEVGMTGGRPVPVDSDATLLGRIVRLQWDLHDAVARIAPKLGELVAFRRVVDRIDEATAVDEAFLEAAIRAKGLRCVYVGDARVAMKGPSTLADFLAQRRRIHAGHLALKSGTGHEVSTLSLTRALAEARRLRREGRASAGTVLAAAVLEALARALGFWDARIVRRDHRAWRPIASSKKLTP